MLSLMLLVGLFVMINKKNVKERQFQLFIYDKYTIYNSRTALPFLMVFLVGVFGLAYVRNRIISVRITQSLKIESAH